MEFRSDNAAPVAPKVLERIVATNEGTALAYGGDRSTADLEADVREVFEHASARVFPVTSGTAGNALVLSAMTPPWGAVMCHDEAHILVNEAGATSLLASGALMIGLTGDDFQIGPDALNDALHNARWNDPHASQPSVLSVTQATEHGTVYTPTRIAELTGIAKANGLRSHLDGARLANAIVSTGCSPADMTWRAGIDAFTLGATKNGAMSAEAIVTFDDSIADELVFRTKRSGHVTSKMRFQSAQLSAYLADGYWLELAENANARMRQLADGLADLGCKFINRVDANILFADVEPSAIDAIEAAGVKFYRMQGSTIRLVTSWATTADEVDAALAAFRAAVS